jgi:hypothetical protein
MVSAWIFSKIFGTRRAAKTRPREILGAVVVHDLQPKTKYQKPKTKNQIFNRAGTKPKTKTPATENGNGG